MAHKFYISFAKTDLLPETRKKVDPIFFHATVVMKNHSKDPQRNGTSHGTDIIYRTVLSAGLRLSRSI